MAAGGSLGALGAWAAAMASVALTAWSISKVILRPKSVG
jgi:hypothetical protein